MNVKKLVILALAAGLIVVATGAQAADGDPYADLAIEISRVTSGKGLTDAIDLDTSADDGDDGSDATGAPDWSGTGPGEKWTSLGIDLGGNGDPSDDVGGWVILAFTDNVCVDGAGDDLYIYDAYFSQSLVGNESADIDIANGSGPFSPAGSVGPPPLGYGLDVLGALPYFTRVSLTATDYHGSADFAGLDVDAVECLNSVNISDISLGAEPANDINPVGTEHTITATLSHEIEGVEVTFDISGPNSASSGAATTDSSGEATFAYTGSAPGTDSIVASVTFEGTPISADTIFKHWVDRYVTGGGNYKVSKTVHWSFAGTVGVSDVSGLVGNFQVQDHYNKMSWHFNQVNWFYFPDGQTAKFEAETADGISAIFTIEDLGEPGKDLDTIDILGSSEPTLSKQAITGGNFQVRHGRVPGISVSIDEGWGACGQGGAGAVTFVPFAGGVQIFLDMTDLPASTSYDLYLTDFSSHLAFGSLADPWFGKGPTTYTVTDCNTGIVETGTRTAFLLDGNLDSSPLGSVSEVYEVTGVAADTYEIQLAMTLNNLGTGQFRTGDSYGDAVIVIIP